MICQPVWKRQNEAVKVIVYKVLSLLETCFDLISSSSFSMKIQIMGGKITENPVPALVDQKHFVHFSFHFQIFHKKTAYFVVMII